MEKPRVKPFVPIKDSSFLYYGLLAYIFIFYTQLGSRFPVLAPLRLEFVLGFALTAYSLLKIVKGEIPFKENPLNLAAFLFLFVAFMTIPFAFVKIRALDIFIRFFKFFAIYLMIISSINNERKLKVFVYLYLGMIALLFVQPFFLSLQGEGFVYNNHMMRLAGVTNYFKHPNQLGGITAANLPFFYYLMKYQKSKAGKLVFFALLLIALRVVMLTQSRTAFLGAVIFGLFIWVMSKKKLITSLLLILACALIWNFAPQQTKDRFLTFRNVGDVMTYDRSSFSESDRDKFGSMGSRWILFKHTLIVFAENPIFGVGLGCFRSVSGRRWGQWFPPHSTYAQALAEMGIIGFLAFCYLIITIFKNLNASRNIMVSLKSDSSFIMHMIEAVTAYLTVRLGVSLFGIELYANCWWVAGGLSLVILRITMIENQTFLIKQTQNKPANQVV